MNILSGRNPLYDIWFLIDDIGYILIYNTLVGGMTAMENVAFIDDIPTKTMIFQFANR